MEASILAISPLLILAISPLLIFVEKDLKGLWISFRFLYQRAGNFYQQYFGYRGEIFRQNTISRNKFFQPCRNKKFRCRNFLNGLIIK
jgi:hypothetical protein